MNHTTYKIALIFENGNTRLKLKVIQFLNLMTHKTHPRTAEVEAHLVTVQKLIKIDDLYRQVSLGSATDEETQLFHKLCDEAFKS